MRQDIRKYLSIIASFFLLLLDPSPALSQKISGWSLVFGFVEDSSGIPIAGAKVSTDLGITTFTDKEGRYVIAHFSGTYEIAASAMGYQRQSKKVTIAGGEKHLRVDFVLSREEIGIENVYPTLGIHGEGLTIRIKGKGLHERTRVTMSPDLTDKRKILGMVDTPGPAYGVVVRGGTAYVADGFGGLQIVDVNDPAYPSVVGSIKTSDNAWAVALRDNMAYVAEGFSGLRIVDIADGRRPVIAGSIDTPGDARGVMVVGKRAYVADGPSGLHIIDVGDVASPYFVGTVDTPGFAGAFDVAGDMVYVADGDSGMQVIDASDPTRPVIVGSIDTPGIARGVAVTNDVAYVADDHGGLRLIDIGNPVRPVFLGSVDTPGLARKVAVAGTTAYVADWDGGLQIIDVSDSSHPVAIGAVYMDGGAVDVFIDGGISYVANDNSDFLIIDVSDPAKPSAIGMANTPSQAQGVAVEAGIAYVADWESGLQIIDVSSPAHPVFLGSVDTPGLARRVDVAGDIALVVDEGVGLQLIDVGNPANPKISGFVDLPGIRGVAMEGDTIFVADSKNGLQIVDVRNPALPVIIGSLFPRAGASEVSVEGGRAYLVDDFGVVHIIDVGNPLDPKILGSLDTPGWADEIEIVGNILYVVNGWPSNLQIIDVSDPVRPSVVGMIDLPENANQITVADDKVHVVGGNILVVVDVGDPVEPIITGLMDIPVIPLDIVVSGEVAYVANNSQLLIFQLPAEGKDIRLESEHSMTVTLPSPIAAGHYNLQILDDRRHDELRGAVTFKTSIPVSKAIILAGFGPHADNWLWEETLLNANYAYRALLWQGYTKENIFYLNSVNLDADGNGLLDDVDADATLDNLSFAVNKWTLDKRSPAEDLLLYMIDHGSHEIFQMKYGDTINEKLRADTLAGWLNTIQTAMPGRLLFIYDACYSGSFLKPFAIPVGKRFERISITSSAPNEKSKFLAEGRLSFSYQFWASIFDGASVAQAFNHGFRMMSDSQTACLDANGNGIPNERGDIITDVIIGRGYKSAPLLPTIESIAIEPQGLQGGGAALLGADFADPESISRVWAVIIPPEYDPEAPDRPLELPVVDLRRSSGNSRFEAYYDGFVRHGSYQVIFYAEDKVGSISLPKTGLAVQNIGPDIYEEDNNFFQAKKIVINDDRYQEHTFHQPEDADWIKFYAIPGEWYTIEAKDLGAANDVVIEVYDKDGTSLLKRQDFIGDPTADERLDWICGQKDCCGVYYVKFYHRNPSAHGEDTEYKVGVKRNVAPLVGSMQGFIYDAVTQEPLPDVIVTTDRNVIGGQDVGSDITDMWGRFKIPIEAGKYTLHVMKQCYESLVVPSVSVEEHSVAAVADIFLKPAAIEEMEMLGAYLGTNHGGAPGCLDFDKDGDVDGLDLALHASALIK